MEIDVPTCIGEGIYLHPAFEVLCKGHAVDGVEKPVMNRGFIHIPDGPGLGITLNEAAIKEHLDKTGGYWDPTTQRDTERSGDNLFS